MLPSSSSDKIMHSVHGLMRSAGTAVDGPPKWVSDLYNVLALWRKRLRDLEQKHEALRIEHNSLKTLHDQLRREHDALAGKVNYISDDISQIKKGKQLLSSHSSFKLDTMCPYLMSLSAHLGRTLFLFNSWISIHHP